MGVWHFQNQPTNRLGSGDKLTVLSIWPLDFLSQCITCIIENREYLTSEGRCERVGKCADTTGKSICAPVLAETSVHEDMFSWAHFPDQDTEQACVLWHISTSRIVVTKGIEIFFFPHPSGENLDLIIIPFLSQAGSAPVS